MQLWILASEISVLCYESDIQLLFEPDYFHRCRPKQRKLKTKHTPRRCDSRVTAYPVFGSYFFVLVVVEPEGTRQLYRSRPLEIIFS